MAAEAVSPPAFAANTSRNCAVGDAPSAYGTSCQNMCSLSSNGSVDTWECSALLNCTNGYSASMYAIEGYSNTADYVAFGSCNGAISYNFCCALDETDPTHHVDNIILVGTSQAGGIYLNYSAKAYNLQPAHSHSLNGYVYGGDNPNTAEGACVMEYIEGSDYQGNDYGDLLYGQGGCDTIHGWGDSDVIDGGGSNDFLYGGVGNDHMQGGNGDDEQHGEEGNDTICDMTGNDSALCANNEANYMDGGTGNDVFWYNVESACPTPGHELDPSSDPGTELNQPCGDSADWAGVDADWRWLDCAAGATISAEPAECPPVTTP